MSSTNVKPVLSALLLMAMLPSSGATMTDDDACKVALFDAQAQLIDLKNSGELVLPWQAASLVDRLAGSVCGFSIEDGVFPADKERLAATIAEVTNRIEYGDPEDPPEDPNQGPETVACAMGGGGDGTITATILGIVLDEATAAGEWTGANGVVDLTGTAAVISGNQAGLAGGMFVGPAGPLPAVGDSGATCLETTSVTAVEEKCWWLIIYTKCTTKVTTKVSLTLCGASANQDFAGLGLLTYDHEFVAKGDPCGVAQLGSIDLSGLTGAETTNSVVISETIDEITLLYPVEQLGIVQAPAVTEVPPFGLCLHIFC